MLRRTLHLSLIAALLCPSPAFAQNALGPRGGAVGLEGAAPMPVEAIPTPDAAELGAGLDAGVEPVDASLSLQNLSSLEAPITRSLSRQAQGRERQGLGAIRGLGLAGDRHQDKAREILQAAFDRVKRAQPGIQAGPEDEETIEDAAANGDVEVANDDVESEASVDATGVESEDGQGLQQAGREGKPESKAEAAASAPQKLLRKVLGKLFEIRVDVQKEAREVLREHLGGDIGDGQLHRDVDRVVRRLVMAAGLPKEAAQTFLGASPMPNAFTTLLQTEAASMSNANTVKAFRISNMFVSHGLLRSVNTEARLAFVIAHELMHNWKGHLKDFSGAGHAFLGHFHELEADAEALKLIAKAGYDPKDAIDTLYDLDKEYDRLEKEYALIKRDKNDLTQSLQRLRDIHPHSDIRRANLLDHLDEALENYKPVAGELPTGGPANPLWLQRRLAVVRPTSIDRFENRLKKAIAGADIETALRTIERFIEDEGSKGDLDFERYMAIEQAYRSLAAKATSSDELRFIEVAAQRQAADSFPTKRLKASLIKRQLELTIGAIEADGHRAVLTDFMKHAASLGVETRRAGTLMLLGRARNRVELDAAFRGLTLEAENLGLDLHALLTGARNGQEQVDNHKLAVKLVMGVSARLWGATRTVLSDELGRPALPEEIIEHIQSKTSAAWLRNYRAGLNVQIIESAFGPEKNRSKLRPSELAAKLAGLKKFDPTKPFEEGATSFSGFDFWSNKHYRPPQGEWKSGKIVYGYERLYIQGLKAPSLEDQLDLLFWFTGGEPPSRPFVKVLQRDGQLDAFLNAALEKVAENARKQIQATPSRNMQNHAVSEFGEWAVRLVGPVVFRERDLGKIRTTVELVWNQVEKFVQSPDIAKILTEETKTQLADEYLQAFGLAIRQAVVFNNLAGERPRPSDMMDTAALVRRVEAVLRPFPGGDLVKAYARHLRKNLGDDKKYMKAFKDAIPYAVLAYEKNGKIRRFFRWVFRRKKHIEGVPDDKLRSLSTNDFVSFFGLFGDPNIDAETKVMASLLLDRIDHGHSPASMPASSTVGRWLLEDGVEMVQKDAEVGSMGGVLLRVNDLHPGFLHPDLDQNGTYKNAFRTGAQMVRRNEAYRSLAKGEHPFRGINSRWAINFTAKLDGAAKWPTTVEDRLDMLDFLNANGEFSDALDKRIIDTAKSDVAAFRRWLKRDKKRIEKFGGYLGAIQTPIGNIPVPQSHALRIVRNPNLRTQMWDLLPEVEYGEKAPISLKQRISTWARLLKAYRKARKHFSKKFLDGIQHEGSLEDKYIEVLEEVDRIATERAAKARKRWDEGKFTRDDIEFLESAGLDEPRDTYPGLPAHEKEAYQELFKENEQSELMAVLYELYLAFAGTQEPLLQLMLDNYPEPTRSRDELLERLVKARRLSPASLSFLESNKSYRQPNPLRIAEKHLLDLAVIQLKKFSPAEKVDILLHIADVEKLSKDKESLFNRRILSGDRKKLARELASIKSISQMQSYMTLLHAKDRGLLVRALFYGEKNLHSEPLEVERLFEKLVVTGRDIPEFVQKVLRAYFKILLPDEKARLISDLAAVEDVSKNLTGPQVVRIALKGMGVSGKKLAQVLATHKGLLPKEYGDSLEEFKEKAQAMEKIRAYGIVNGRLGELIGAPERTVGVPDDAELEEIGRSVLPKLKDNQFNAALRQVKYLLKMEGRRVRYVELMGPELGSGSIKVVYKVTLDDGRIWVVKVRVPGAAYRIKREFEILDQLIKQLESEKEIDVPGAEQLLEEVKQLVRAEMDFRDEAKKESAMLERVNARPAWYGLFGGGKPYVPKPHPKYVTEDLMVEEFAKTRRYSDLPVRSLLGPSQGKIARLTVQEGMFALLVDEWLEPDPHTGNRHAVRGWFRNVFTRMVLMDLGQGQKFDLQKLKPLMRTGLALDSGDVKGAAASLLKIVRVPANKTDAEVLAALEAGLVKRPTEGIIERIMDSLLEGEKKGALVLVDYAPVQKAFLIYTGYSERLPKDYIFKTLEKAAAARLLKDGRISPIQLVKLGLKRAFFGRAAVRAQFEALINTL